MATSVLLAFTSPTSAETDAELSDWYVTTHIPQVREAIPAITAVRRFRVVDPADPASPVRYIAMYEIDSAEVHTAAEQLRAASAAGRLDRCAAMDVASNPPALTWAVGV